ncbi:hypothetical protein FEM03_00620 [Phragmitibacter flavus]|uniref:DUF4142 domain-containing protein n=1 Tax=Phragmitibacter flavus TaxID=2576071 RepID=A0A5R8KJW0_9BACT|nr:hypothetical protein [Phragmitibacter flavus]TLD72613.1 hypothetical protein FEM03_00620 [Phragmitibacter flavus]
MKPIVLLLAACALSLPLASHAQVDKIDSDKAKDALQKLLGEVKDAADKATKKSSDKESEDAFWERSKDHLTMDRVQYSKKATRGLAVMDAEIQGLADTDAPVSVRDYFKLRVESLKLNLAYCREEFAKLEALATEEEFRSRQRFFDRNLAYLSDHLVATMKEAGH